MNIFTPVTRFVVTSIFLFSLIFVRGYAQTDTLPPTIYHCGFNLPHSGYEPMYAFSSPSSPLPAGAIFSCNPRVKVYYEDVAEGLSSGHHAGFDDTTHVGTLTLGEIRRNTMCMVMDYVQQTFDFSLVDTAHPIRILIRRSLNHLYNPSLFPINWDARYLPSYLDTFSDGVTSGYFAKYVQTGVDPDTNAYHCELQFNFDVTYPYYYAPYISIPVNWHSDGSTPLECNSLELYSALLHEIGHAMGWMSYLNFTPVTPTSYAISPTVVTHHVFTAMDTAVYIGSNSYPLLSTGFTKAVITPSGIPGINPVALSVTSFNNYWLKNHEAPDNHPIYSGVSGIYSANPGQFISHLDDQFFTYTFRSRVSPGDRQPYVMGAFNTNGSSKRKYTEADLYGFHDIMGYAYNAATFSTVNPNIHFGNTAPFSQKMAGYAMQFADYGYFTEAVTPDYTLTNNTGAYIDIYLDSMTDIVDADGDNIIIDTSSLVNFRGCGSGGNNHDALTWLIPGKALRYIPRHNFYGKAQLGFSVSDTIEKGSFVIVTIEVVKGNNVSCLPATNMVCNPGFEEGSEVATQDFPTKPNSTRTGVREGKWQGVNFGDSHPYEFHSNISFTLHIDDVVTDAVASGLTVQHSYTGCYGSLQEAIGTLMLTCPNATDDNPFPVPPTGGARYQSFRGTGASYYYLLDTAKHCSRYRLEFDYYKVGGPFGAIPITVGFTDTIVDLHLFTTPIPSSLLNFRFDTTIPAFGTHDWHHVSIPFTYCGTDPSTVMYIANPIANHFHIDNLSLAEDTSVPPPLLVNISVHPPVACSTRLVATDSNAFCDVTYSWATSAGSILTSTPDSSDITVPSNVTATYIVTANDGCRVAMDTAIIVDSIPTPISGTSNVCAGSTTALSSTPLTGTWTSSDVSVATVGTFSGIVTGISAGTADISYHYCGHDVWLTVTVSAAVLPVTGTFTVCAGSTVTLTSATPGGSWASSNPSVATIGSASGTVTGVSGGTATISYLTSPTCYATATMTIHPIPAAIGGPSTVCNGSVISLTNATTGGTWSSATPSVATIGTSGVVTGISPGTATIAYTLYTGCQVTKDVTVLVSPATISGEDTICNYTSTILANTTTGGTWASGTPAIAIVGGGSGMVTGVSAGTAIISYTILTGCYSIYTVTVLAAPTPITGTLALCEGATTTLTSTPPNPFTYWSSSAPAIAPVSVIGVVSGHTAGTATISYTNPFTGCYVTADVTVNPMPTAITGFSWVCNGSFITLTGTPTGGTWASSTTSVATVGTSGIVSGITAGTTTITYTLPGGCYITALVTVDPIPPAIVGPDNICTGAPIAIYTDALSGGTWSVSDPSVATILYPGGVQGVSPGTATLTYTLCGNHATKQITVNASPAAITGITFVCPGYTTALHNATSGGTWSSSNPSVGSVDPATGVVTGIATGTVFISYTNSMGCYAVTSVTVSPILPDIIGNTAICVGATSSLTDYVPGGTWVSSDATVATIGSTTGLLAGVSVGTASITYSLGVGCSVVTGATVNPTPSAITGTTDICAGTTTTLSCATSGGTWSSSLPIASINPVSGIVSGIIPGTTTISYSLVATGCVTTTNVTVHSYPVYIGGTLTVCGGNTTTLTAISAESGTWSSSNVSVATVGSATGVVTGVSAGTATITFSVAGICNIMEVVTVDATPASITGDLSICEGTTTTLSSTSSGGVWGSSDVSVGTIDASGNIAGVAAGVTTISYEFTATGCFVTADMTVNVVPVSITGDFEICQGANTILSDATAGGTWGSSNTAIATIGTSGLVTGISGGTAVISYASSPDCYVTTIMTIDPLPAPITGTLTVCQSATTTLSSATPGGTWSSSNIAVATAGSAGIVTGVSNGTTTISYTLPTGCITTADITVNPLPAAITGTFTVCVGANATLSDATASGTWSSSNIAIADIGTSGVVSGISDGTATISYTLPTGCFVTHVFTVNPLPGVLSGTLTVCEGFTTTLSSSPSGGVWISSTTTVATIGSGTGIVTGVIAGTTAISYTLGTGCLRTETVTVNTQPAAITGTFTVCQGGTTTLSDITTGGTWGSSNTSIATVGTGGVVSGVSAGTTTITYTSSDGCFVITTVTVNPLPATISGTLTVCEGATTTLADATSGGTWSSSSPGVGTIDATGNVTGIFYGTTTVSYQLSTGCFVTANVTVNALPPNITGSPIMCQGATTVLSNTLPGGTWGSSDVSVATVGTGGIVTGVTAGTARITYTNTLTGCYVTRGVTVNSAPSPITGTASVCVGANAVLSDITPGGSWGSSNMVVATVGASSGIVTGVSPGTANITYQLLATGCYVTRVVTVNPPGANTSTGNACVGQVTTITNPTSGGVWSSSNTAIATISPTGDITGVTAGAVVITYAFPATGCYKTTNITVYSLPTIGGLSGGSSLSMCEGQSVTLLPLGGLWGSSNTTVATIGSLSGYVTGLSAGTTVITLTNATTGCYRAIVTTINPLPATITGTAVVCQGATTTLSSTTPGGIWSSSSTLATVGSSSGIVYGALSGPFGSGTVTITYTLPTTCRATAVVTVNYIPLYIGPTGGVALDYCEGQQHTMTSSPSGGTWSSSNTSIAAVIPGSGLVAGLSAGTAYISYTLPTGCYRYVQVTVHPTPAPITGTAIVCVGSTTTLSCSTPGGVWSSTGGLATVGSSSGIVTAGYIPSTTPIYYTVPFGDPYVCPASVTVTITATSAITGVASICLGAATALSSATPGGTWTSLAPSIATVDASGLVTSVAAGSATIVYTAAPCGPAYRIVTVNNIPATITGATSVCTGQTITLSSATVGGVWASGSPGVATVGITGIVTGISPGTAIINYSICGNTVTHVVSVNTQPAAITGITHVCNGLTTTLSDATAGGTWSSSTTSVGTIDASGVVTGLSTGTTTITYSMGSGCIATTIVSVIAAPGSFIGTIYNSVCPGHYVGLVSTTPGGTWSSSNPSVAYVGTGVSAGLVIGVSAGTATLTYSISTGCAITKTVAIYTDTTSACSPCVVHRYHMFNTLGLTSSSVSETPLTGGVYVPNDITISGNVTFNDAVVLIKPNVTIFVEHNSWLTSSGSHFLTCPDGVWEGIKLKTDTTLGETGKITLQGGTVHGSTLIEDAITGVEVHRPVAPNGGGLFIDSKNTIFNRNNTGISIKHYSPATPTSYEFNIENTIFTSRTFYLDFDSVYDDYPHSWPNTTGSFFGLKNIIAVPSVYHAPYNITNFVGTPCHNSIFPGYIGIELEDIGTNTSPAFSGINIGQPSTYSPLVSGSINAQMNLFDTLGFGIYATNANVRVINSTFMKMYTAIDKTNRPWPDHGNTGIYTTMDNGTKYKLTVEPGLYSYASWASAKTISPNRFFNCNYGVYSNDYFLIKGNGSDIRTTHNAVYGPRGYGYLLQSGKYQDVEVNNNKIYNVAKGIVFTSQLSGGMWISVGGGLGYWSVGSLEAGNVKVNYNRIQAAYIGAPTYEYCEDAITVQNIIDPTDPNTATGMVHADNDTIDNVYRGIHVSGYWQQKATSNGNIITVRKDPSVLSKCWGICHANCMQDSVHENRVTAVSPVEADDSVSAYFMRLNNNAKVMCNYATGTGRGYEFYDINANAKWKHNHMNGNLAGLYLNYSRIDPQGSYYDPADNVWDGSTWSTATGHYQTFVLGPPAANESPLHVRYISTTLPIHNRADPFWMAYSSAELPYSPGYPGWPTPECRTYIDDPSEIGMSAYTGVALHNVTFGSLSTSRNWVSQMVDWLAVNMDTTLTDTSVVLQSFAARGNLSRFKYLTNIEGKLLEGDMSGATTALGSTPSPIIPAMRFDTSTGVIIDDDSTVDYLVNTYKTFYGLHLNYKTHAMTSSDSARVITIAELCPLEYGRVVYQARALYTAVFQEVRTWDDTCFDFVDTTGQKQDEPGHRQGNGKGLVSSEMQHYKLYPNPNDGNIVVSQMISDTGMVIVIITDVAGRVVYRDNLIFAEGKYQLTLNKLSPGIYFMQLTDSKTRKYNFKFVKE